MKKLKLVCSLLIIGLSGSTAYSQKLNTAEERIFRAKAADLVEEYYKNLPKILNDSKKRVIVVNTNDEGEDKDTSIIFKQQFIDQYFENNDVYVYNDLAPGNEDDNAAQRVMTASEYLDQFIYYYGEQKRGTFQSSMNSANVIQVGYNSQAAEKFYYAKIKIQRNFKGYYLGEVFTNNFRDLDFYVKTIDNPEKRLKEFKIIGIDYESKQIVNENLSAEEAVAKGVRLFDQEDYEKAFKYLIKHKDNKKLQKNSNATWALGYMYFWGRGTDRSDEEMVKWLEHSAKRNNIYALYYLGENYYYGEYGVEEDEKKAFKYIKESARKGYSEAQYFLGQRYEKGEGIRQSTRAAKRWYGKASKQGHVKAKYALKALEGK